MKNYGQQIDISFRQTLYINKCHRDFDMTQIVVKADTFNIAETGVKPTELTLGQLMPLPKPRKT